MKTYIVFDADSSGYTPGQVEKMTVKELIEVLEGFDENLPVVFQRDNGYTYGIPSYFREEYFDEED